MIYIALTIVLLLLLLGQPIFVIFALLGSVLGVLYLGITPAALAEITLSGVNIWVIVAVPFFILAGNLMVHSGCGQRLFDFIESLVGHLPGGAAISVVLACAFFSALSGSSIATASAIGTIALPSLEKAGYPSRFSTGLIAVSGTMGNLIPPSIYFIIFGSVLELSVGKLFMAGILPGLLMTFLLSSVAGGISYRKKYAVKPVASWGTRGRSIVPAIPALLMPAIVLGGIYGGIFTPTEAAAIACLYGLLVGVFVYRGLNLKNLWRSLSNTMRATSMIYLLIGTAIMINIFFTYTRIPQTITGFVAESMLGPIAYMLLSGFLVLVFGCFLDALPIIYIAAPLLFPAATTLGIDPIQFAVFFTVCLMVGQVTPPVGLVLYATSSFSGESADSVIRGAIPFLLAMLVGAMIIVIWPSLSLFLPGLIR